MKIINNVVLFEHRAQVAQLVEHFLGKEEVTDSIPVLGSTLRDNNCSAAWPNIKIGRKVSSEAMAEGHAKEDCWSRQSVSLRNAPDLKAPRLNRKKGRMSSEAMANGHAKEDRWQSGTFRKSSTCEDSRNVVRCPRG